MTHAEHDIIIAAPLDEVRALIADATAWPLHFAPTVHVEQLAFDGTTERLQIWAKAGEAVKTWTSVRVHANDGRLISFRQEVSQAPIAEMSGAWLLEPTVDGFTHVTLRHSFRAVDDDPQALAWIAAVTDQNSQTELANLKQAAEAVTDDLTFSFEDTVVVEGAADDVYAFLYDVARWPERLPHVSRMILDEPGPDLQVMEMDSVTAAGARHTTKSIRVGFDGRIVYKQIVVPPLMAAHTGEWSVTPTPDGLAVTSQHSVVLRRDAITTTLGASATVATARAFVQDALSTNSGITLQTAKDFAERAVAAA